MILINCSFSFKEPHFRSFKKQKREVTEIYYEDLNPYFVPLYGAGMVVGLAIFGGLGYFMYGGLGGAFAIILVMFFYGLTGRFWDLFPISDFWSRPWLRIFLFGHG
jgi:hypothetical protein